MVYTKYLQGERSLLCYHTKDSLQNQRRSTLLSYLSKINLLLLEQATSSPQF